MIFFPYKYCKPQCKTQKVLWNPFAELRRGWMICKLCSSMISENKTTKIALQFIYCDRDGLVQDGCGPSEVRYLWKWVEFDNDDEWWVIMSVGDEWWYVMVMIGKWCVDEEGWSLWEGAKNSVGTCKYYDLTRAWTKGLNVEGGKVFAYLIWVVV